MKNDRCICLVLGLIMLGTWGQAWAQDQVMTSEIIRLEVKLAELEEDLVRASDDPSFERQTAAIDRHRQGLIAAYERQAQVLRGELGEKITLYNVLNRDTSGIVNSKDIDKLTDDITNLRGPISRIEGIVDSLRESGVDGKFNHLAVLRSLREEGFQGRLYSPLSFMGTMGSKDEKRLVVFLEMPLDANEALMKERVRAFLEQLPSDKVAIVVSKPHAALVGECLDELGEVASKPELVVSLPRAKPVEKMPPGSILFTDDHTQRLGPYSSPSDLIDLRLRGPSSEILPVRLGARKLAVVHMIGPTNLDLERLQRLRGKIPEGERLVISVDSSSVRTAVAYQSPPTADFIKYNYSGFVDLATENSGSRFSRLLNGLSFRRVASGLGIVSLGLLISETIQDLSFQEGRRVPPLDDPVQRQDR